MSLLYQLMVNLSQMERCVLAVIWAEVGTFSFPADIGQAFTQTYGLKYCFSAKAGKSSQRALKLCVDRYDHISGATVRACQNCFRVL